MPRGLRVLSLLLLAAAFALARRKAVMLIVLGTGLVLDTVIVVVLLRVGRDAITNVAGTPAIESAFASAWDSISGSLVTQTIVVGVLGLLAVGAGVMWRAAELDNRRPAAWA